MLKQNSGDFSYEALESPLLFKRPVQRHSFAEMPVLPDACPRPDPLIVRFHQLFHILVRENCFWYTAPTPDQLATAFPGPRAGFGTDGPVPC